RSLMNSLPDLEELPGVDAQARAGLRERRGKLRIAKPFPGQLRGVDDLGNSLDLSCVLENLSSSGVYLWTHQRVRQGSDISIVIYLSTAPAVGASFELHGRVLRVEPSSEKRYGLAVGVTDCQLL
ncbi:MAG: PilZ domain-containing protein, partial [Pyrinomonadaceae bacterium]